MNRATSIKHVSQCSRCPALGKDHVPSSGPASATIAIIGQSPGVREIEEGAPFVGPCGEMLDFMLDEAGVSREEVYITNALKCHPPGNRRAHPEELDTCFDEWLKKELKFIQPSVIVLLGKDAWQSVTRGKIPFKHGAYTRTSKGRTILTLYHPSYFLRRGDIDSFVGSGTILRQILDEPAKTSD